MKHALRALTGSVASIGMLSACGGQSPEAADYAASAQVEVSVAGYQHVLAADAPINIVHVPAHPETNHDQDDEQHAVELSSANFWAQEPAEIAQSLTEFAMQATGGKYAPNQVNVTEAGPLSDSIDCIGNADDNQVNVIQRHLRPYLAPGEVNISIIDLPHCGNKFIAYAGAGLVPILSGESYASFNITAIHEVGHSAGLEHAGTLTCSDAIAVHECDTDPTGDVGSIMSYMFTETANDFSFADLMQLNILNPSEITVPAVSGDYELTDPMRVTDQQSPKGLVLPTETGTVYVSWEEDDQARFDTVCAADSQDLTSQRAEGVDVKKLDLCSVMPVRENGRSLQVRLRDRNNNILTVLRPSADGIDGGSQPYTRNGEIIPGAVVYEDAIYTVSLTGQKTDETAVVHVDVRI